VLEADLLVVSGDLDGVWDELGGLLLGHRGDVLQQDSDLERAGGGGRCTVGAVCAVLLSHKRARAYQHRTANRCIKTTSYRIACVTLVTTGFWLSVRVEVCTQWVRVSQWFPSGRCYCRNKASSPTDKGGPEAVCPSAERRSSLEEQKRGQLMCSSQTHTQTHTHTPSRFWHSPTISRSVSGSFLKSLRKSSFRCLYVGLRTWRVRRGIRKENMVFCS